VFSKNPDRMARLQREAEMLASLNHPNIAAFFGPEDGDIVMELVDRPTLGDASRQPTVKCMCGGNG